MRIIKSEVIGVTRDAWEYLGSISREQRGCEPLTQEQKDRMWERTYKVNDLRPIDDNTIGGGDGTYNGRWWTWDVATIKKMLTDAGFTWVDLGEHESIDPEIRL